MDIFIGQKKTYKIAVLLSAVACLLMVIFPSISLLSAQKGISLWASSVLPALLPFFICANFMNYMGITGHLSPSAFAFIMSIMSGYPMGAKIIGDMIRCGIISQKEGKKMLSFCSTSGPTFMIGAVGISMLGNADFGAVIAISHYLGAMLNGVIFFNITGKEKRVKAIRGTGLKGEVEKKNYLELFTEAISSSFKSLGIILAYIVLFMFITDIMQFSGILNLFELPYMKAIAKGMMEMTVGCASLSACIELSDLWKCVFCTFLISWGGLSAIGQTVSMLSGSNISFLYVIAVKAGHSLCAALFALIIAFFMI